MYACLIPYEKLETLKEWSNQFTDLSIKEGVDSNKKLKGSKKVLHQTNQMKNYSDTICNKSKKDN
jgi:hypothetical protein